MWLPKIFRREHKPKITPGLKYVPTATAQSDLWWVKVILNVGRPVVAVIVLVMCAPGEHYLAKLAGWSHWLAWGMPATLTAYAGIAAVVATKRPKESPGKKTAVAGAVISVALAMGAQPIAHLYERGLIVGHQFALTVVVSCIPALVFGHLLHMAAAPVHAPREDTRDKDLRNKIAAPPEAPEPDEIVRPVQWSELPKAQIPTVPDLATTLPIVKADVPDDLRSYVSPELFNKTSHEPAVYFLRNGQRVKIGTTTNLGERVRHLSLRPEDVLLVLPGGETEERAFHDQFRDLRLNGTEWFWLGGPLVSFLRDERDKVGREPWDKLPTEPRVRKRTPREGSMSQFIKTLMDDGTDRAAIMSQVAERFGPDTDPASVRRTINRHSKLRVVNNHPVSLEK
jgi:hypothetical protein